MLLRWDELSFTGDFFLPISTKESPYEKLRQGTWILDDHLTRIEDSFYLVTLNELRQLIFKLKST